MFHQCGRMIVTAALCLTMWAAPTSSADTVIFAEVGEFAAPRAQCGPGSLPETGLQGDVPTADRDSLRSTAGYRCNMSLIGGLQNHGGGLLSVTFDHCSYTGTFFPGNLLNPGAQGVQVVDVADPRHPVQTTSLNEPAMLGGTWESLRVNKKRKLLAATAVPMVTGVGYFSIYDISDCAHPKLLNRRAGTDLTMPMPFISHEGGFSPDGNTYWASGTTPGVLSAIDVADPTSPRVIWQSVQGLAGHGFGVSPDGNRMYYSIQAGINILDISAVQRRDPYPSVPVVATYLWHDGQANQHTIPVTYDGTRYAITVDEIGSGGVKFLDISDERRPRIARSVKLEINLPQNIAANARSAAGGSLFAYESHYCTVDRPTNPTAMACSWISSGIRVFDIRDLNRIREIAYYNPPAQTHRNLHLPNSAHALASLIGVPIFDFVPLMRSVVQGKVDVREAFGPRVGRLAFGDLSSDWCFSPPEFRGNQIWTSCSDNGFMALRLDNNVYRAPADQDSTIGS